MSVQSLPRNTPKFSVSVLGLPSCEFIGSTRRCSFDGVGKSSLCSRFVFPAEDDFAAVENGHGCVVSSKQFHAYGREMSGSHVLYFGSAVKRVGNKPVIFNVLEHTTFVDDDIRPHEGWQGYHARATSANLSTCARKRSYLSLEFTDQERHECEWIDGGSNERVDGYVLVLDPNRSDSEIDQQLDVLEMAYCRLQRGTKPACLAISKCDATSRQKLVDVKRTISERNLSGLAMFDTSAKSGVSVNEPFFFVFAASSCQRADKIACLSFEQATCARSAALMRATATLNDALCQIVDRFEMTWSEFVHHPCGLNLGGNKVHEALAVVWLMEGRDVCEKLFLARLLKLKRAELRNVDISTNVASTADIDKWRLSKLVEACTSHPDLKRFVNASPDDGAGKSDFYPGALVVEHNNRSLSTSPSLDDEDEDGYTEMLSNKRIVKADTDLYYNAALFEVFGAYWYPGAEFLHDDDRQPLPWEYVVRYDHNIHHTKAELRRFVLSRTPSSGAERRQSSQQHTPSHAQAPNSSKSSMECPPSNTSHGLVQRRDNTMPSQTPETRGTVPEAGRGRQHRYSSDSATASPMSQDEQNARAQPSTHPRRIVSMPSIDTLISPQVPPRPLWTDTPHKDRPPIPAPPQRPADNTPRSLPTDSGPPSSRTRAQPHRRAPPLPTKSPRKTHADDVTESTTQLQSSAVHSPPHHSLTNRSQLSKSLPANPRIRQPFSTFQQNDSQPTLAPVPRKRQAADTRRPLQDLASDHRTPGPNFGNTHLHRDRNASSSTSAQCGKTNPTVHTRRDQSEAGYIDIIAPTARQGSIHTYREDSKGTEQQFVRDHPSKIDYEEVDPEIAERNWNETQYVQMKNVTATSKTNARYY